MSRKNYSVRTKWPYAQSLANAAVRKLAQRLIDEHARDGVEAMERAELVDRAWKFAQALSPFDRQVLITSIFTELSFREIAKREHLRKKDVERIFNDVCAKLKRMLEQWGRNEGCFGG